MEFSKYFDHTILNAAATMEEVDRICKEAIEYRFASVCVNGAWTKAVAEKLTDTDIAVCTVIGFPLGAMSTRAKRFETLTAIEDGATEIDMVDRLFPLLLVFAHALGRERVFARLLTGLSLLEADYPEADLSLCGFPEDWRAVLEAEAAQA